MVGASSLHVLLTLLCWPCSCLDGGYACRSSASHQHIHLVGSLQTITSDTHTVISTSSAGQIALPGRSNITWARFHYLGQITLSGPSNITWARPAQSSKPRVELGAQTGSDCTFPSPSSHSCIPRMCRWPPCRRTAWPHGSLSGRRCLPAPPWPETPPLWEGSTAAAEENGGERSAECLVSGSSQCIVLIHSVLPTTTHK